MIQIMNIETIQASIVSLNIHFFLNLYLNLDLTDKIKLIHQKLKNYLINHYLQVNNPWFSIPRYKNSMN